MRWVNLTALIGVVAIPAVAAINETEPWYAGVWRPTDTGPSFVGTAINANGGKFWVDKNTTAHCPEGVDQLDCSLHATKSTSFVGGNGGISLAVTVPGGQQVYIAPDGSLSFTAPHSVAKPEGSIVEGFVRTRSEGGHGAIVLYFEGRIWQLCPANGNLQVYSLLELKVGCYAFQMRTYVVWESNANAWEYT